MNAKWKPAFRSSAWRSPRLAAVASFINTVNVTIVLRTISNYEITAD